MRITGGAFRGRTLAAPPDVRVRPTPDKVRQAVFNIVTHNDFGTGFSLEGARVADLFAGTGAMGIEAISRGARFCLFVDDLAESRALIRQNVEALQLTGVTKIWRRDATQLGPMPAGSGGPFDLVFLDPPYTSSSAELGRVLSGLDGSGWLAEGATVVVERPSGVGPAPAPEAWKATWERAYGDTLVTVLTTSMG